MKRVATVTLALVFAACMAVTAFGARQQSSTESSTTTTTRSTHTRASKANAASKLDINSASQQELESLPGIGPATSAKIVEGRPYRAKSDLVTKKIVSHSEYNKIKDQIVAHQKK